MFDGSGSIDPRKINHSPTTGNLATATPSTNGPMVSHTYETPGNFTASLTVSDPSGQTNTASVNIEVTGVVLPPDPEDVAPPISETSPTQPGDLVEFIYTGTNPIQRDVVDGAISKRTSAWIRGRVLDRAGAPISGVRVSVLNNPDWGHTLTRTDGEYDFVVNNGGSYTIDFQLSGYLPSQRRVVIDDQGSEVIEDLVLIQLDPKVLNFTSNSPSSQFFVGSSETDESGTRTPKLYVKAQTEATIVLPDGNRLSLPSLNVRITEYTVGESGPNAMPGTLPPNSAYTYAFEASADEALALGSDTIEFDEPISFYLDNFLGFAPGVIIPVGFYNRKSGLWEAEENGLVINYQGNDTAGLPILNIGFTATQEHLDLLGIDQEELENNWTTIFHRRHLLARPKKSFFTSQI